MDIALEIFLYCLALGGAVGFFAGLLGIGGGLIIVPVLIWLLPKVGVSSAVLMPVVLATSLAAILLTAISTLLTHHKKRNIPHFILPALLSGVGLGGVTGGYIADLIPSDSLKLMFAVFAILMSLQMWLGAKQQDGCSHSQPDYAQSKLFVVSFVIGVIASLLGVGGGVLLVPFLTAIVKLDMRRAIGASAAVGFVVSAMGTMGYLGAGLNTQYLMPSWSLGYIYVPALLGIICTSLFTAPVGVRVAQRLPVKRLKQGFSILLFVVALEILIN